MRLSELCARAGVGSRPISGDAELTAMVMDSRKVTPGALFVCYPAMTNDSHQFLPQAKEAGAIGALVYNEEGFRLAESLGVAVAQLPSERLEFAECVWRLCDEFFEHPTRHMKVVGITGTNGKTTVAWLVRDMLEAISVPTAYLGTLGFQLPPVGTYEATEREVPNTTPFAVDLYNMLAEARDRGVQALAMEVSSHALAERRCDGVEFDVGVFTNLTQDHLDYHGTMEEYEAAKFRLFTELPKQSLKPFVAAINVSDPAGKRLAKRLDGDLPMIRYRLCDNVSWDVPSDGHEMEGVVVTVGIDQIHLVTYTHEYVDQGFIASLGGGYNVENLLSATAAFMALGYPLSSSEWGINDIGPELRPVPGRFEAVPNKSGIGILVDYAHTPDALEKLLAAVRPLTRGRIITVFGCGGDRDKGKRPLMARAAASNSDLTVVTSDNPRTEDPQTILDEVMAGLPPGKDAIGIIDRAEAVAYAVKAAHPGDVVVIAGKGHENYQIIGRDKYPMDDRDLAMRGLRERA